MSNERAIAAARRLGERAGRRYINTGIFPRNPFRTPAVEDLAAAWRRAAFATAATVTRNK